MLNVTMLSMTIKTTTIGAYPKPDFVHVPDWFTNPDTPDPTAGWAEAVEAMGDEAEAVFARGTRAAVEDQVSCGIDIPSDGEIRRENYVHYHCRHLDGFDFEGLTETDVRGGNYRARLPTIRAAVSPREPFLDHDYRVAQACTKRPIKMSLPGPMTISDTTVDDYYGDAPTRCAALADALNVEVLALANAGCRYIQIDEPVFARKSHDALSYGIDTLQRAFHGCPAHVTRVVHICCGYPDRLDNPNYPKAPQAAYHELAAALNSATIDTVSLEDAHRHNDLELLESFADTSVILGVLAIAKSRVEQVDEVRDRLRSALDHIDAERLIAAPDCGLGLLPRDVAMDKLHIMCDAVAALADQRH